MPLNLGSGAISGAYVGSDAVTAAYLGSTSVFSSGGGGGGITPNNDNRARFYLPSGSTSFTAGAATTTGYYRITDGTSFSSVGGGNYYATTTGYWYYDLTNVSMTGLSSSSPKVMQVFACDAAGNPSGELVSVGITQTNNAVDAIDVSGCLSLVGLGAYSSAAYGTGNFSKYNMSGGSSQFPSSVTEVRAVGVSWTVSNTAPNTSNPPGIYYYGGGVDISDQDLDAAALDQLYSDLGTASGGSPQIIVRLNPGTASDNPSIATAKGYTVYGS